MSERRAPGSMSVPLFDLRRQTEMLLPSFLPAVERVLRSGRYILGPEVETFEGEAKRYLGSTHAIGVANGTDALWLALRAASVGPGDQVLTTAFTFMATASAIRNLGATPIVVDIDPATFNIDVAGVRRVLDGSSAPHRRVGCDRQRLKALVVVHLYGQAADLDPLVEIAEAHGLALVEDAAQAFGTRYGTRHAGTVGHLGCFSFFPTKNLGALGDGGLVVTNDAALAAHVRVLRAHGSTTRYIHDTIGTNSRLDALQAALLSVKLQHVGAWIEARQAHADAYDAAIARLPRLVSPHRAPGRTHTFHQYTIRVPGGDRDPLRKFLKERGVETSVYYPLPLHLQPALAGLGYRAGDFPEAERASEEALSLPMFPELTDAEIDYVCRQLTEFESARA